MNIISIALKDLKILLKDKRAMALVVLMPIVIIWILGLSLQSLFDDNKANIGKNEIALVDYDNTDESKKIKSFLESDTVSEYIKLVNYDEDEAKEKVKSGDLTALIIINKGYNKVFTNDGEAKITLYKDKGNEVGGSVIQSIINKYSEENSNLLLSGEAADSEFEKYSLPGEMVIQGIIDSIDLEKETVKDDGINDSGKGLSAMQYYSAAMVCMYIMFVGMVGSSSIAEERENNTLKRLLTTKATKTTIVVGKFLGIFLLGLLDNLILILFTKFVYNVNWGNDIIGLILLSVSMTFAASGLAMLIATLFKNSRTIDMVNPVIILVISFIGGNMIPLYEMSEKLRQFSKILFNNWALRGYLNLMVDNRYTAVLPNCGVLVIIGVILLSIGINRLNIE